MILDFKDNIVDCNSKTYKLFKYKKEELLGKNFLKFIALPANTIAILEAVYIKLIKSQEVELIEIQVYTKDGKLVWVNSLAILIRLSNEIVIQVISQDITEEKLKKDNKEWNNICSEII